MKGTYTQISKDGNPCNIEHTVDIVKESKRYYWIRIFNSIQRKKKHLVSLVGKKKGGKDDNQL